MNSKTLIVGYGEVGRGLENALKKHYVVDIHDPAKGKSASGKKYDVINVCIPWSENFDHYVEEFIKEFDPKVCIVHSTVSPKTLHAINRRVVFSPVRGMHPDMTKGILTFEKLVGGCDEGAIKHAEAFLSNAWILTVRCTSLEAIYAKLLDTTYYGVCISFAKMVNELCEENGLDFDTVYTRYNQTYNQGYAHLGETQVIRPVLYPPDKAGAKGHCVLENAILLKESCDSGFFDLVLGIGKHPEVIDEEKLYLNKTWLYCEYWGKGRTQKDIANQFGVTKENISAVMKRRGVPVRVGAWTEEDLEKVIELHNEGKTFAEIAQLHRKSYESLRSFVYNKTNLKSHYDPSIRDDSSRIKISCSLRGITEEEFNGFKEPENKRIRKSVEYQNWRNDVLSRDNFTCQNDDCGFCQNKRGVMLNAHHIVPFAESEELRFDRSNGITYCELYHKSLHNLLPKDHD